MHPFISWLMRPIGWLLRSACVDLPTKESADKKGASVALVTQNGKPVLPPRSVAARPFWRKLNDQKNKRAFRRKKGRASRRAWRRP